MPGKIEKNCNEIKIVQPKKTVKGRKVKVGIEFDNKMSEVL